MDLTNVKDLQKKMRICDRIHSIGFIACIIAYATGGMFLWTNKVTGIVLLGIAVLLALISGIAQVIESLLYAEDLYRITGRRPRKKNKKHEKKEPRSSI
jgi:uncharacterized sodium:solute symporter family permease YidK